MKSLKPEDFKVTKTIKWNGFSITYPDVAKVILGKISAYKIINNQYSIN